jgi:hypothetical protein
MSKKKNHTAEPSKLTRFQSFEEMKSAPFAFPSTKSRAQRLADQKEAFDQLRSSSSLGNARGLKKTNKTILK